MTRRFENPWSNPVGEVLCTILTGVLRYVPKLYDTPHPDSPEDQPDPPFESLRFCKDCGKATQHSEFFWRTENETTIECSVCGGIWVTG